MKEKPDWEAIGSQARPFSMHCADHASISLLLRIYCRIHSKPLLRKFLQFSALSHAGKCLIDCLYQVSSFWNGYAASSTYTILSVILKFCPFSSMFILVWSIGATLPSMRPSSISLSIAGVAS